MNVNVRVALTYFDSRKYNLNLIFQQFLHRLHEFVLQGIQNIQIIGLGVDELPNYVIPLLKVGR